ncbi:hypothetical protein GGR57DRAFT_450950 [Xylariaceae sp. FL1272]|nr:hypothetical protein GGR57DRAFT_450950 [Xylariaceae sp. FL1272]
MSGMQSTGRGGAGNIADASNSPRLVPSDLQTPHLKTPVVTTGRGGSGNMAPNTDPVETRARQDVEAHERPHSTKATHVGRGGAANVARSDGSRDKPTTTPAQVEEWLAGAGSDAPPSQQLPKGLAAKAKDFFKKT